MIKSWMAFTSCDIDLLGNLLVAILDHQLAFNSSIYLFLSYTLMHCSIAGSWTTFFTSNLDLLSMSMATILDYKFKSIGYIRGERC